MQIGQIVEGPLFSEPMRVETVRPEGAGRWVLGLVGLQSERFRSVTLSEDELATLHVRKPAWSYAGEGQVLRLGLQAYALGLAHEYDPYFGLSISRVDPLPHQLEAVYDYLLKLPRVRFLLADDAGAGKTIMAGLLLRELKLRKLVERVLVVCPANLAFQWQRELAEKFREKFLVLKGDDIRDQFGLNQWMEHPQVITSLDLAKRANILPGLRQVHWDMVIVDEAHHMSAYAADKKSLRYRLGELLRDTSDHLLLLTATPHRGDPQNFSLFLQLLDEDAFADVKSIRAAMERRRAPFYLRRTKEAMVYFPERQPDGTWAARKIFKKRIPRTVEFRIDGDEDRLYREVTAFVRSQSRRAAEDEGNQQARAVAFLMALYQRRLASSTHALRCSLENRIRRLQEGLRRAQELVRSAPARLPDPEDWDEMEDSQREKLEEYLDAVTMAQNPEQIHEEVAQLRTLAERALQVEKSETEAKLSKLQVLLREQGFFDKPDQRLLIFTEFKDTLDFLQEKLTKWGFRVGIIHGGMKPGSRDEEGSRLHSEQQFREGNIQVLVATEAAGEGINLQCCNILFNYDIPWNPNRLEQRMGRIHRYGQTKDCLIFNYVAVNTIEGRIKERLLTKLREIRDALDDDAVFNVVGEILPAAQIERVLREFYAGDLGEGDLEDRLLRDIKEDHFRAICQNALEGLASKRLNLEMLVERKARAQERRVVPESIARFMRDTAARIPLTLRQNTSLPHTFEGITTPPALRSQQEAQDWRAGTIANRYPRFTTDRETAEKENLEWVTPGHPLFEAMRRHAWSTAQECLTIGACFYSVSHAEPARIDFYRARVVDGLGDTVHERLFAVQIPPSGEPTLHEPGVMGNLIPASIPETLPSVASAPEALAWLHDRALSPFLREVKDDRIGEVNRVQAHVELSLTELIAKEDQLIGRFAEESDRGIDGAAGNLKQAEDRHRLLTERRERRRQELERQRSLSLQGVERLTSVLVFPHPDRNAPDIQGLHYDPETEDVAMRVVIEHERAQGRVVSDIHEKDLGYDITSLDTNSGDLRLIEIKGIGASTGTVFLTPNEKRVAEDRPECYWLYVVTNCKSTPTLETPIPNPARFDWHEVRKVDHYSLTLDAIVKAVRKETRRAQSPTKGDPDGARKGRDNT